MREPSVKNEKKCYIYSRVSTEMQVDGYSLDAQENKMRQYADYAGMKIAGEYRDEGKSGKSIEGRPEFKHMLDDIKTKKDNVSYVLVYKLSRFGRNAADVLSSLQKMKKYSVNLICVDESIDSSKDSGKLMISVLSAVAEVERENILAQTMEGRRQKAREGKWNGGFAPYGYKIVEEKLQIAEDEIEVIKLIFDKFIHTEMGVNSIARYLNQQGIKKKPRQNGKLTEFTSSFVRGVLDNPIYAGKIAYGRRTHQLVEGTDDQYETVKTDDYILVDGIHEAIITEKEWEYVIQKRKETGGRKEQKYNFGRRHLLSSILKCPVCGENMYGNVNRYKNKETGELNSEYYYYQCKHRRCETIGNKCNYSKQWKEEKVNHAVEEVIYKLVRNEKFSMALKDKIGTEINTDEIDASLANCRKKLAQIERNKAMWEDKLNNLNEDNRSYQRKYEDYNKQLDKAYDAIVDVEDAIESLEKRKASIEKDAVSVDKVYKYLMSFDRLYAKFSDDEKKTFLESFIEAVHIYPEEQKNGRFLKRIDFKFPIEYDGNVGDSIVWDNESTVETVVLMSKVK